MSNWTIQEEEKDDFGKLAFEGLMGGLQQPMQTRKHRLTRTRNEEITTSVTPQDDNVEEDTRWQIEPVEPLTSWLMYTSTGVIVFVALIYHVHWQNYVEMFSDLFDA